MSTSSAYSSNKLKQILDNGTQHFIIKSYIYPAFEYGRKKSEYHIYWVNMNKGAFEENPRYQHLSCKIMNKKEMKLFLSILDQYEKKIDSNQGIVWENKKLGLDKNLVKNLQYTSSTFINLG